MSPPYSGLKSKPSEKLRAVGTCFILAVLHSVQSCSEAIPASYAVGTGGSFPEVQRPEREADHSPTSSAKVKNAGAVPPHPHNLRRRVGFITVPY
jgi:hypothetical protein